MEVVLIISSSRTLTLSFLLKDRAITEIKVERRGEKRLVGSIFKGKVKRLAKNLDGAFLDIGLDKEAYLPLKSQHENGEMCCLPEVGDDLIVQMKREPTEDKGGKVTCRISIPGRYLVYLPTGNKVFISSKIGNNDLKIHFKKLFEKNLNGEGVIVRTSAEKVKDSILLEELNTLRKKWNAIKEKASGIKTGMVYEEVPLYAQIIRDNWHDISEIIIDDRDLWGELMVFLESNFPELINKIRYIKNISYYFKKYGLDKVLAKIFARYIWLKSGGYIIIEETEAMTVIDVNSGSVCGDTLEETALRTNLEAAEEIAKHIKLRDIGGIVIIDFIDMKDRKNKEILVKKMKELFADEGVKVHIYGITQLGLLELTRRKETPSVTQALSSCCPACKGKGYVKSREVVLYEIEKEISYFKGRYMELRINPLLREEVERLLEARNLKEWIALKVECNVPLDYYEILLTG